MTSRTIHAGGDFLAPQLPSFAGATAAHVWHFETAEAMAAGLPASRSGKHWHGKTWSTECDRIKWSGADSVKAACDLVHNGWKEGGDKVVELSERIAASRPQSRRLVRWDVAGASPSVARYLAGNPLNMRRVEAADSKRSPIITLLVDVCTSSFTSPKTLIISAAIAAAIVDRLENEGYRAEVIAGSVTKDNGVCVETFWIAKGAGDVADPSRLAVSLGHPAMLRRINFAYWTSIPETKPIGGGLGSVQRIAEYHAKTKESRPRTYALMSPNEIDGKGEIKAFDMVLEHLRAQGCPGLTSEA